MASMTGTDDLPRYFAGFASHWATKAQGTLHISKTRNGSPRFSFDGSKAVNCDAAARRMERDLAAAHIANRA